MSSPRDERCASFLCGLWIALAVASTSAAGARPAALSNGAAPSGQGTLEAASGPRIGGGETWAVTSFGAEFAGAPAAARRAPTVEIEAWNVRELRSLPGIGPRRAVAIVRARHTDPAVGAPATWGGIPGIGAHTIERAEVAWQRVRALRLSRPRVEAYTSAGPGP